MEESTNMKKDRLIKVAQIGEEHAATALTSLFKQAVEIKTSYVDLVRGSVTKDIVGTIEKNSVIAYMDVLTGLSGVTFLTLSRPDALHMVDLLNARDSGTTQTLQELDRSAVREVLNIISNSYITQVAQHLDKSVIMNVPRLITSPALFDMLDKSLWSSRDWVALFKTNMSIGEVEYQIHVYFFFVAQEDSGEIN
jgi:chemotaxis protein CheC